MLWTAQFVRSISFIDSVTFWVRFSLIFLTNALHALFYHYSLEATATLDTLGVQATEIVTAGFYTKFRTSILFQAEVMDIYRATLRILVNNAPFTRVPIFCDRQAAIISGFMQNSRIVRECCRCLDLLFGHFSVSLVWFSGHSKVLRNCRADELASTAALLSKSSSIEFGVSLTSLKLAIVRRQPITGQWGILLHH